MTQARISATPSTLASAASRGVPFAAAHRCDRPVAVDLDGTLIRTDVLAESLVRLVVRPRLWPAALAATRHGIGALKAMLAAALPPAVDQLPYREDLVAWLREQRRAGRRVVLATGADERVAQSVADHLGVFDHVIASSESVNRVRDRKRDAVVRAFGRGGFDWIGSEAADRSVAVVAHAVVDADLRVSASTRLRAWARALRWHQWSKNLLVGLPLVTSHRFVEAHLVAVSAATFVVFNLAASAVYLVNDAVDVGADRAHAVKRRRPLAAGDIGVGAALAVAAALACGSLALAFMAAGPGLVGVTLLYILVAFAYTARLKQIAPGDTVVLAGLYVVRVFAGLVATGVAISYWLLGLVFCVFWSLALAKRASDLADGHGGGALGTIRQADHVEQTGRDWAFEDRPVALAFGAALTGATIVILSLYAGSDDVRRLYARPEFIWAAVPLLAAWLCRLWLFAWRGWIHTDPVFWALKDRTTIALLGAALGAAALGSLA